jgi:uncharacterized membrane protein YfcA
VHSSLSALECLLPCRWYDAVVSIDPSLLAIGLVTLLIAGLVQGLTGFGFALVSVPILTLFLSPKMVAPMMVMYGLMTNLIILYHARRFAQPRHVWPLALGGVLGVPIGVRLLVILSPDALRLLIGITVTLAAIFMALGVRVRIRNERLAFVPVGLASGILSGSIAVGGPPVILFFTNQGVPREVFRANITIFFSGISLAAIISFTVSGLFTSEALEYVAWFFPGLLVGVLAGNRFTNRLPEGVFRAIALVVVAAGGVLSILNALGVI